MIRSICCSVSPRIADDGKDGYEIEISYEEADADLSSTKPEELKKALQGHFSSKASWKSEFMSQATASTPSIQSMPT